MAATNINHEGYERRILALGGIVKGLGLDTSSISPVEYVDHAPFAFNNFVYKVELAKPATAAHFKTRAKKAYIFAAFQGTTLLDSLHDHFGGLTFAANSQIVGGQMPLLPEGPWQRYKELWVARFKQQLKGADNSSLLNSWRVNGIRDRIDKFVNDHGIAELLKGVDTAQRVLVHGDLKSHTGIFLLASDDLSPEHKVKWKIARAWDALLAARGAIRPSSIHGIDRLERLRQFEELLCPFDLGNEVMIERLKRKTPEWVEVKREAAMNQLLAFLDSVAA
ncbi:uncharacterized protein JN550_012310 [Neoarthrinium moseri]|uniref:uncharacterized protein n=1 Tax=Neoarthrinium moseri TaxID=1658444 RepID=UPI001FDE9FA9|nr:uncharacterized protein JN550_012310 [Neoarthrinium moseri]KAI1858952.1 hypothetical protein JN550_012310 [Neoarthrinium moseri]